MERELNPMILDCIGSVTVNSGFSIYREVYKNKCNVCVCVYTGYLAMATKRTCMLAPSKHIKYLALSF